HPDEAASIERFTGSAPLPARPRVVPNRHTTVRKASILALCIAGRGAVEPLRSTHPTERRLRRFLRHLLSFCALPALVLLLGEAVLQWSGELWPIDRVLAYQRTHPDSLFLRATDQVFYAYKYRAIVETRPGILVAGSSRTMKF